ncbi:MAG: hypothetical protein F6K36_09955 [Symploca sp. SIO3C6]|nr:hypothetical protein [Symploca sp. SIO3C6]
MNPIFQINSSYLEVSALKPNSDVVEVFVISGEDYDSSCSEVVLYNLKTGKIKKVLKEEY